MFSDMLEKNASIVSTRQLALQTENEKQQLYTLHEEHEFHLGESYMISHLVKGAKHTYYHAPTQEKSLSHQLQEIIQSSVSASLRPVHTVSYVSG